MQLLDRALQQLRKEVASVDLPVCESPEQAADFIWNTWQDAVRASEVDSVNASVSAQAESVDSGMHSDKPRMLIPAHPVGRKDNLGGQDLNHVGENNQISPQISPPGSWTCPSPKVLDVKRVPPSLAEATPSFVDRHPSWFELGLQDDTRITHEPTAGVEHDRLDFLDSKPVPIDYPSVPSHPLPSLPQDQPPLESMPQTAPFTPQAFYTIEGEEEGKSAGLMSGWA